MGVITKEILRDISHSHRTGTDVPNAPLRVTVIYTDTEGTRVALAIAGVLARNLKTSLVVEAPIVVPWSYSLEAPHVSTDFIEQRLTGLVAESGIHADEATIQIRLCRNRNLCLSHSLSPGSMIVIGGKSRWYFQKERKLERFLNKLGHQVMFIRTK